MIYSDCAVPQVEIRGAPDIYVMAGSGVVLHCVISGLIDTPPFIFWYHNKRRIAGSGVEKDVLQGNENTIAPTAAGLTIFSNHIKSLIIRPIIYWAKN